MEMVTLPVHPHPLLFSDNRSSSIIQDQCEMCLGTFGESEESSFGYRCGTCEGWVSHKECAEKETVHLPTHPHPLSPFHISSSFFCQMCDREEEEKQHLHHHVYQCGTCSMTYHKECAESPSQINHPFHPRHPLTFLLLDESNVRCNSCGDILTHGVAYHCPICSFFMHISCTKKTPQLHVENPKCHDHTLTLLPRPLRFTCNACGLLHHPSIPYVCHRQCDFMVHRDCIDLPRVIRISRHHHRLSRFPSLPPPHHAASWSCCVCRKPIDHNFGSYSCNKDGCLYTVHSICATRGVLWDGKDLEGVPDEPDEYVDPPFELIDGNLIKHFSHEHYLKLDKDEGSGFDGREHCQACALPICIHVGDTYSCSKSDCEFVLHERCAELPRKEWYILHPHQLTLQDFQTDDDIWCYVCFEKNSGFAYQCREKDCNFVIDVNCALVSEPFAHSSHPHPLFSTSTSEDERTCSGCKSKWPAHKMQCMECDFVLDFYCLTSPPKVRYKHDEHPLRLTRGGGDDAEGTASWWCEICEEKMDKDVLLYTCDNCCVTVHVHCILGEDGHIKPGRRILELDGHMKPGRCLFGVDIEVEANKSCSRPFCSECENRCRFSIVFKADDLTFCSSTCCIRNFGRLLKRN